MALSLALQQIGSRQLFPRAFDAYGDAAAFVPDGECYREDAVVLAETLRAGEFRRWLASDYQFHEKLYSICFALFGWLLGFGVVGAEPLNLLIYLASLFLVFRIGREIFDRRAGLLAAVALALWPSLLLHTTQLVKDSLCLSLALALALLVVRWTTRDYSWAGASLAGASGALLATAIWLARSGTGLLLVATVLLGVVAFAVRLWRERRAALPNLAAAALLVAATLGIPFAMPNAINLGAYHDPQKAQRKYRPYLNVKGEVVASSLLSKAAQRVRKVREGFIESYPYSGSNIDADVSIDDWADLVRYLPRAAEIGFFAPFPAMWIERGELVGSAGRLLAGVESLAMYFVEGLAVAGLWFGRRSLAAWFLFSVAATGASALGLVVVNVGALYRLRYPFLALLIVLAAGGVKRAFERTKMAREIGGAA